MGDFRIAPATLVAIAGQLRAEGNRIEQTLQTLDGEVQRLTAQWTGGARCAYEQAQREWTGALDELVDLLARVAHAAEQMAESYVETDRRAAGFFPSAG